MDLFHFQSLLEPYHNSRYNTELIAYRSCSEDISKLNPIHSNVSINTIDNLCDIVPLLDKVESAYRLDELQE